MADMARDEFVRKLSRLRRVVSSRRVMVAQLQGASTRLGDHEKYAQGDQVLDVVRWDGPDATPVLLVHGIGMGRDYFGLLRDQLLNDRDVIGIDLPGFGASPTPAESLSIPETADLLAAYLGDRVGEPVIAVGHSMGAQVVTELAVRHPALVERLVLIAPSVNPRERSARALTWRLMQDLVGDSPRVVAIGARLYASAGMRWFLAKLGPMLDHRIELVAPAVTCPTLVIAGADDRVCPLPWVRELAALIPGARLQVARDRGHEAIITDPEPIASLIRKFAA